MAKCRICLGSGTIEEIDHNESHMFLDCPDCDGTGVCNCGQCGKLEELFPEDYI